MYNILIVDDEYLIRVAISSKIRFSNFPFENMYFADNGNDALTIIETNPVDIMMVDIRMPGMDGLALIRKAKEMRGNIHFIVISGYADFEYARDALQSGVEAYILKPIDDDQFIDALNRLREKIDLQFKKLQQTNEMELNNQAIAIEREMNLLLHATPIKLLEDDRYGFRGTLQNKTGFFQLMMIRMENRTIEDKNKFDLFKKQIVNLVGVKANSPENCIVIDDFMRMNRLLVVIHTLAQSHMVACVNDVLRSVVEMIREMKGIVIGTSAIHDKLSGLLYSEALWACDLRLLYEDRVSFAYNADLEAKALPKDYYDDLKDLLATKEFQLFEARIREVLDVDRIITLMYGNIREVIRVVLSLIMQNNDVQDAIKFPGVDECIESARNIEDVVTFIYNDSESLFFKDMVISTTCKEIIEKVENHIRIHYKSRILLRELAAMYNMNSNYMSSVFKKVVGKGFSDYLTQVRLKHACDMLVKTKMGINEIAQESGFDNSSYFYRVFKTTFGITPLKYRNQTAFCDDSQRYGGQLIN